jgi:hypothetical protein
MFYARLAIATCMEAADPRSGETCPLFNAKLRLFENASAPTPPAEHPDDLTLTTINSQHVPVANTTEQSIAVGDEIMVGETIDERWVVINGGAGAPRIQFVTTSKMASQQVAVKVLRVHGAAPDLSGGVLQFGSTLNVTDPFNLWAEVEPNATGWAYYVAQSADDPETTGVTEPTHPARYEIEECSLPIKELEGTISSCLLKGNTGSPTTAPVTVSFSGGDVRSSYPNVDTPPEASGSGAITAHNNYFLDAVAGSKVWIRRTTNLKPSTPEDYALGSGSATTHEWEITRVEKKIARWAVVRYMSAGGWEWSGGAVYDGFSAFSSSCEPSVSGASMSCLPKDGTTAYAFYNPEGHEYIAVSTISALLGPPGKHPFIKGSDSPGQDPIKTNTCAISVRPQLNYTQSEIYGWSTGDTNAGCTDGGITDTIYNVDMGFASAPAMTGMQMTCGSSCTFTAVADGSSPTGFAWSSGSCTGAGCGNCVADSGLPTHPADANATYTGVCKNDLNEAGLCFSKAYFLYCGPDTGPTIDPGPHCIPVTDCPEDSTGGG